VREEAGFASDGPRTAENAVSPSILATLLPAPRRLSSKFAPLCAHFIPAATAASRYSPACLRTAAASDGSPPATTNLASVFGESSAGLHQPLRQAGERPLPDRRGQRQLPQQIAEVVGDDTQPEPHLVGGEAMAASQTGLTTLRMSKT
jgi:hypothetical protein